MLHVDHVAFRVTDLEISIRFYRDLLGVELMSKTMDPQHHEAFAFLKIHGCDVELLQLLDETGNPVTFEKQLIEQPFCPHLALRSDDLDGLVDRLTEKKITIIKGPLEIPGMVKWLYVADPDNNIIEFVQWINRPPD